MRCKLNFIFIDGRINDPFENLINILTFNSVNDALNYSGYLSRLYDHNQIIMIDVQNKIMYENNIQTYLDFADNNDVFFNFLDEEVDNLGNE